LKVDKEAKMKILIKFILLSFVLLHASVSYAASGKQLLVPIFGDITVFVPIISAPASANTNVTSSAVGEEIYDISWSAVSAAAYYQLIVTNESGEKSYFETSVLNYRLSGLPLGNNRVEILACNSKNQCGASSLVGNFNSRLKVTYSHTDVLGSPIVETDQSGKVVNEYHYKPFGDTKENKKEAIGYTGHLEDPDIQLTYMQARYYDPVLGRFYGNDPIGYRDTHSFNRYAYANNNPYKYVDPSGNATVYVDVGISAKMGSIVERGVEKITGNEILANGGKAELGIAISFPAFDGAAFDAGITATFSGTDFQLDEESSFVSLPGLTAGGSIGASTGSVGDLRGQSAEFTVQANIGKTASKALVSVLPDSGLKSGLQKTAGSLLGFVGAASVTGDENGNFGGELGLSKGLNAGISTDVGYTMVCSVQTGCGDK
jgi:RHS repeat-associated protein